MDGTILQEATGYGLWALLRGSRNTTQFPPAEPCGELWFGRPCGDWRSPRRLAIAAQIGGTSPCPGGGSYIFNQGHEPLQAVSEFELRGPGDSFVPKKRG